MFSFLLYKTAVRFAEAINVNSLPGAKNPDQTQAYVSKNGAILEITRLVFGAFGAIAVLIIAIAGVQYVISQGEAQKISKAKNTIIYAVLGLIISITAYGIVSFVLNRINVS